ncbi:hypothetical protein TRAPUB_9162 [Trametes pubescens]|uniref:C2H2-type domain-containing protein n=1 Tax=Trametes pubescens TaxID=154538 RepID=A0A1M2W3G1_TRAPU|nr:hypothetical protein TRAPUB_9162 [Trametes pubescens]
MPGMYNPSRPPLISAQLGVDMPSFEYIDMDGRIYKTLKERRGERWVVFFYCDYDYPGCPMRYCDKAGNLRAHQRGPAHNPAFERSPCDQCDKSFTWKRDLQKHIRNEHSKGSCAKANRNAPSTAGHPPRITPALRAPNDAIE